MYRFWNDDSQWLWKVESRTSFLWGQNEANHFLGGTYEAKTFTFLHSFHVERRFGEIKCLPWRAIHRLHRALARHWWMTSWRPKWGYITTLPYFTMSQCIVNCGLCIAFGTMTHSDCQRSRVGLHFCEVKMRLTTFWEVFMRLKRLLFSIASMLNSGSSKLSV